MHLHDIQVIQVLFLVEYEVDLGTQVMHIEADYHALLLFKHQTHFHDMEVK
jgi:hypothetical protein